jgi:hypothetical protein
MDRDAPEFGSTDWDAEFARVYRLRFWMLGVLALAAAVPAGGRGDWNLFVDAGRDLVGGLGLELYAERQDIQTGPITLLAAWLFSHLPTDGFVPSVLVVAALGIESLRRVERIAIASTDAVRHMCTLLGGIVVVFAWAKLGGDGHLDDAAVLGIAVAAVASGWSPGRRAVALGLAVAIKPWAVIVAPLVLAPVVIAYLGHPLRVRLARVSRAGLTPTAIYVAIVAAFWAPFVIAAPSTLDALRPSVLLADDSVLALFGVNPAELSAALRSGQLVLALAVAAWCVWRGTPHHALMAAVGVRLATDPATWSYYTPGLLIGTMLWDHGTRGRRIPILTLVCGAMLVPAWIVDDPDMRAVMRLVACVLAVGAAITTRPKPSAPDVSEPVPSADPTSPTSDRSAAG